MKVYEDRESQGRKSRVKEAAEWTAMLSCTEKLLLTIDRLYLEWHD